MEDIIKDIELKKIKTPMFYFDKTILVNDISLLKAAILDHWENTEIACSVKTNNLPHLISTINSEGLSVEVVSHDEYNLVRSCGYDTNRIICNGAIKKREWFYELLGGGAVVNIDSKKELEYSLDYAKSNPSKTINVGLRVNIDIESAFDEKILSVDHGSRFGFSYECGELKNAISILRSVSNIKITGLHMHSSTNSRELKIYKYLTETFIKIVGEYNLSDINYFDIGGGFFGGIKHRLNWDSYLQVISTSLSKGGFTPQNLKLIVEPGVSLLAGAFTYFASVVDSKQTARANFVITDGSRLHLDPFLFKDKYFHKLHSSANETNCGIKQIVSGFTCLEYDRLFTIETDKPLGCGDILIFERVGAYTISFNSKFISLPPNVYSRDESGNIVLVG